MKKHIILREKKLTEKYKLMLVDVNKPGDKFRFTPDNVTEMVSELSDISVKDMKGKSRKKDITCARFIAIHYIRKLVYWPGKKIKIVPYKALGIYFNRDHTSAIRADEVIDHMLFTREELYVNLVNDMENKIAAIRSKI